MRIASIPEPEATGRVRTVYDAIKTKLGRVTPAFQSMSLKADYLEAFWNLHSVVLGPGELVPREKEAIALAVSATNRCAYCVAAHSARLKALGADHGLVEALTSSPESAPVSAREAAILRFALRMTRDATAVRDEDLDLLRKNGLTDAGILEAAAIAAHFNGLNRFLDALDVRPLRT